MTVKRRWGSIRRWTRFPMRNLWSAVWKPLRCASHASEVGGSYCGSGGVYVYRLFGLGFGSDVTVVVRVDEPGQ